MNLRHVEEVVRDRLGLDPAALGPAVLPRAVETRMRETGVATPGAYLARLATPAEAEALAAELVVPETWFFRGGRNLFDKLAEFLAARAVRNPGTPARALSLPCSTGEEPHSLAIAMHDRLTTPESYRIDALDLSARNLDRAAAARFPAFSFREPGRDIRPTYFREVGDRWELLPPLRRAVRVVLGNVTAPDFLAGEPPYDLILCRNLFIYLTADGRKRAVAALDRLLAADGWLCLTPAEADRLPAGRFTSEGPTEFGVYRRVERGAEDAKRDFSQRGTPSPAVRELTATSPRNAGRGVGAGHSGEQHGSASASPRPALRGEVAVSSRTAGEGPSASPPTLPAARALADAGRLADARVACERLLATGSDLAEAHTLLGVILQAEGKLTEAADAFRKALYLAPDNPEALSHMIVLTDRRGDAAAAAVFRRRLARVSAGDRP